MSTVAEIIRDAQDMMCRLEIQRLINIIRDQAAQINRDGEHMAFLLGQREYVWPSYPQSLGELCLEEARGKLKPGFCPYCSAGTPPHPYERHGIVALRALLYHDIPAMWRRSGA